MKHRIIPVLFASALSFTSFAAFTGVAIHNQANEQPAKVEAGEGSYYSSISDSLTGTELLNALHTLNSQKRTRTVGYNGMKTFAAKCDADPDGSGKIIGFYDNAKVGPGWDSAATWNREHVWPNVRDGDKVEDDPRTEIVPYSSLHILIFMLADLFAGLCIRVHNIIQRMQG